MKKLKLNTAKIKYELERNGWSQSKLANMLTLSRAAISDMLKREYASLNKINQLAELFNIDPKDLLI